LSQSADLKRWAGGKYMTKKSKTPVTLMDYQNMVKLFLAESDRAAALLAGSVAEGHTETLLRGFTRTGSNVNRLFEIYGPLSSFSARINVAYAFGLIDQHLLLDLNIIKRIRNHFAHEPRDTSFTLSPVREFCANLSTRDISPEPRIQYLIAVGLAVGQMHNILLARKQAREEQSN